MIVSQSTAQRKLLRAAIRFIAQNGSWQMKAYNLIWCSIIAAIVATPALAKSNNKTTTPIQATAALAQPSDLENILKIVTQMQSDLKTLQTAVANLAESQKDDSKQVSALVKDMTRRLYATCVLTQRQMNMAVPGGWSENALCTYQGLTAAGEAVTRDIFGQNPTNIDTVFGGP